MRGAVLPAADRPSAAPSPSLSSARGQAHYFPEQFCFEVHLPRVRHCLLRYHRRIETLRPPLFPDFMSLLRMRVTHPRAASRVTRMGRAEPHTADTLGAQRQVRLRRNACSSTSGDPRDKTRRKCRIRSGYRRERNLPSRGHNDFAVRSASATTFWQRDSAPRCCGYGILFLRGA